MAEIRHIYYIILLAGTLHTLPLVAQNGQPEDPKGDRVELKGDKLSGSRQNGEEIIRLLGNVMMRQGNMVLFCDSAINNQTKNYTEGFGNVRIIQGDTLTIVGQKATYDGKTKIAVVSDKVVLNDRKMTLRTDYLSYDTEKKYATYQGGGKINDGENNLESQSGYYNTDSKIFHFKKDVKIVNLRQNYTLTTDTIQYRSGSKIAVFRGPTWIDHKGDKLYSEQGEYDTYRARSKFNGRVKVVSGDYILESDHLYNDEKSDYTHAQGNVKFVSVKKNVLIEGDLARYNGTLGVTRVTGNPIMKTLVNKDTLYLKADTLVSIEKKDSSQKVILAYPHARVYKSDIQAVCDSLVYNLKDSIIHFYQQPMIWTAKNQLNADSISIQMKQDKVHQINLSVNCFAISRDTVLNFNQIKGRTMVAYFQGDQISSIEVNGNAQTLYFVLDEANKLIGMNKADCSRIRLRFKEGKVEAVSFMQKPDASMIPPHEYKESDTRLKGFEWKAKAKPQKSEFTRPGKGL